MVEVKSSLKIVPKRWGREEWIVNCEEYCGKLLYLDKGAVSSLHYHNIKKETFYALQGTAGLTIEGKDYMLTPFARPKTIYPGIQHQFTGIANAVILEISTYHDDNDVVRLSESQCSKIKKS